MDPAENRSDPFALSPESLGPFERYQYPEPPTMATPGYEWGYYSPLDFVLLESDSQSDTSIISAPSSNMGSPLSRHGQLAPIPEWACASQGLGVTPGIVSFDEQLDYWDWHFLEDKYTISPSTVLNETELVDPALVSFSSTAYPASLSYFPPYPGYGPLGHTARPSAFTPSPQLRAGSVSPLSDSGFPYPTCPAPVGDFSNYADTGTLETYLSPETKQRCPHPDCGNVFKDLKAHMLTHQTERPEKCPISMCEYHVKGFAKKYDKNRHTLTHYRGTMVCGFCPGSGSAAKKSFNRADVFKRHLTAVRGVEQTLPGSRKRHTATTGSRVAAKKLSGYAPDATGQCSTCVMFFDNAQEFYEHLNNCVLGIIDPEAIQDNPEEVAATKVEATPRSKEQPFSPTGKSIVHWKAAAKMGLTTEVRQPGEYTLTVLGPRISMPPQHDSQPFDGGHSPEADPGDDWVDSRSTSLAGLLAATITWFQRSLASLPKPPMIDLSF
ncbi:hypothetical protein B0T18DRAFT_165339 [Schizothecium vesticola]|uniref:Zinc finger protein n=1 Tax=Schizothecium vesticola TaxID=314040 RepID=A0AA40EXG4_9PEZI|nr:hypothetical protein B0T18DRAFT_165339 [Schizothecium vesticola]